MIIIFEKFFDMKTDINIVIREIDNDDIRFIFTNKESITYKNEYIYWTKKYVDVAKFDDDETFSFDLINNSFVALGNTVQLNREKFNNYKKYYSPEDFYKDYKEAIDNFILNDEDLEVWITGSEKKFLEYLSKIENVKKLLKIKEFNL